MYSETAAANYGDDSVFELSTELMPACRLGTPEEVMIYTNCLVQQCDAIVTKLVYSFVVIELGHFLVNRNRA